MLAELDHDLEAESLYMSRYLSESGKLRYPHLLREAMLSGTDESLAATLQDPELFVAKYEKRKPKGGYTLASVPHTAPITLAEGEFNRFYLRGLCRRLIASGGGVIEIYRARASSQPRSESEAMIGQQLEAAALLDDLRTNVGVDTALGLPPGPNSGLSGRLTT